MLKVVCFKWEFQGGYKLPSSINNRYTAEHVNRLERMVAKNLTLPYEFLCITDNPEGVNCRTIPLWDKCRELGGCYTRLYVFSEDMREVIGERFVCIDLDCVITGSLDRMFSRQEDFIINSYRAFRRGREQYYNGGLFMMTAGARKEVWERWETGGLRELESVKRPKQLVGTDQAWISHVLDRGECMFDEDDGVYNFRHLPNQRELPADASIVFFAGAMDPSTEKGIGWIDHHYWGKTYSNTIDDSVQRINTLSRNVIQETRSTHRALRYVPDIFYPRSFNEKILWLKFFRHERLKQITTDKVLVKEYVERQGVAVKTIPTLVATSDASALRFEDLAKPFIVKITHKKARGLVVDEAYNGSSIMLRRKCQAWLKEKGGGFIHEWVYDTIRPQVLVEPLLRTSDGAPPNDYRLYMMNGKCRMVQMNYRQSAGEDACRFYTHLWKSLDVTWGNYVLADVVGKPAFLARMKRVAEKLAKPFEFVRVDFLETDGELYFRGFTFFPASGCMSFSDTDFDFELGKQLTITL